MTAKEYRRTDGGGLLDGKAVRRAIASRKILTFCCVQTTFLGILFKLCSLVCVAKFLPGSIQMVSRAQVILRDIELRLQPSGTQ